MFREPVRKRDYKSAPGQTKFGDSFIVQDDALTPRQILERFTSGGYLPPVIQANQDYDDDDVDRDFPASDDLADQMEFIKRSEARYNDLVKQSSDAKAKLEALTRKREDALKKLLEQDSRTDEDPT